MTFPLGRTLAFAAFVAFLVAFILVLVGEKGEGVSLLLFGGLGSLSLAHAVGGTTVP